MDRNWLFETGSTSAFADEMGGEYRLNKMIHQPLHEIMWGEPGYPEFPLATPDSKLKRKAPDANRDQERKKEVDTVFPQRYKPSTYLDEEIGLDFDLCMSREYQSMWGVPGYPESPPTTPDSKLKRKAPDANRDQEKKKEVDRAYRQRCKEKKIKNEKNLYVLTEENNELKRENSNIKIEEERLKEVVQTQNGFMKKLQGKFSQLKTQLDNQITLVDVLSKELAKCKDIDRQLEVERLKHENSLLSKKINDQDSLNIIQLVAKNTKLEQEKRSQQMIIDALCMKINQDSDHGIKEAS